MLGSHHRIRLALGIVVACALLPWGSASAAGAVDELAERLHELKAVANVGVGYEEFQRRVHAIVIAKDKAEREGTKVPVPLMLAAMNYESVLGRWNIQRKYGDAESLRGIIADMTQSDLARAAQQLDDYEREKGEKATAKAQPKTKPKAKADAKG